MTMLQMRLRLRLVVKVAREGLMIRTPPERRSIRMICTSTQHLAERIPVEDRALARDDDVQRPDLFHLDFARGIESAVGNELRQLLQEGLVDLRG